jgi:antitoxin MazE
MYYFLAVKVAIVAIGNSRGVHLPKAVLDQVGLGDEAELGVENGRIVLAPFAAPRRGWAEAFHASPARETEEDHDWLEAPPRVQRLLNALRATPHPSLSPWRS